LEDIEENLLPNDPEAAGLDTMTYKSTVLDPKFEEYVPFITEG